MAVLYFDNASRDSTDAYLAEGLTEAIIAQLGRVERLSVKSRFAVRRFHGGAALDPPVIGRILGVTYLVTGSVQRVGHQLRVTTELARASNGNRVWGDQLLRSDDSLFALQDAIAQRVAEGVVGRLLPVERRAVNAVRATRTPEAYQHFLRGDYYLAQRTSTGLARATAEYRQAAALDSGFVSALARVGLAYALRLDWAWDPTGAVAPDSLLVSGVAAVNEALRRDSLNSDAWLARAYLLQFVNPRTWAGVMPAFERAVALDPKNAEAWHQQGDAAIRMGDDSTAVTDLRRALQIDPERAITLRAMADVLPPRDAERLLDSALAVDPGFSMARISRVPLRMLRGDIGGARRDLQASRCEACPTDMWTAWTAWHAVGQSITGDTTMARGEVDSVLTRLRHSGALSFRVAEPLATYFIQVGDTDRAFDLLERIQPRGVVLWSVLTRLSWPDTERFRRLLSETMPPWAPPPRPIRDLPVPAAQRGRWEGAYDGPAGTVTISVRGDSLFGAVSGATFGRLLSQGGDTLVDSRDHGIVVVFNPSDTRATGFTVYVRKRVFPYHRVDSGRSDR